MTYRGEVKNGVVVLEGSPQLADGTKVQVQPLSPDRSDRDAPSIWDVFGKAAHPRTREEIDEQIRQERDGWDTR